jgi:hypothetical protein
MEDVFTNVPNVGKQLMALGITEEWFLLIYSVFSLPYFDLDFLKYASLDNCLILIYILSRYLAVHMCIFFSFCKNSASFEKILEISIGTKENVPIAMENVFYEISNVDTFIRKIRNRVKLAIKRQYMKCNIINNLYIKSKSKTCKSHEIKTIDTYRYLQ